MLNVLIIAVALAMDSFSVAICAGAALVSPGLKKPLLVGFYFGFFHVVMVFLGWLGGGIIAKRLGGIDHWFAFAILAAIGLKMIYSFYTDRENYTFSFKHSSLSILALATSIDAVGVGASMAFIGEKLVLSVLFIGVVVFAFSFFGVKAGKIIRKYIKNYAQLFGGALLIIIGISILASHGVLG